MKKPPKFKKGQVVRVILDVVEFKKIVEAFQRGAFQCGEGQLPGIYLLNDGLWRHESDLRALTKRESGR